MKTLPPHAEQGTFPQSRLVEVAVPAEEAFQEVNHAKIDATVNTSGVMKRLGCDSLEKRSPYVKTLSPHAEQCLRSPRSAPPHAEQGLRTPRSASPHAGGSLRTPRSACGGTSPHAKKAITHVE